MLKRGALVAAANWQVTVIQFMAESTFKMLLSVPVVGGILLVVLVLGRELPELFSPDIRESITFVATALAAEPPALVSFLLAFAIVGLAGSAFMFLLEGRHAWPCSPRRSAKRRPSRSRRCGWSRSGRRRASR